MWTNELNLLQDKGHCNNLSQSKGCLSTSVDREESTEGRTKESAWHTLQVAQSGLTMGRLAFWHTKCRLLPLFKAEITLL